MKEAKMAENEKVRNLDDLALKAGVTAAAVSMALRNSPRLSEEVGNRIRTLAQESGFTPRSYRRRETARKAEGDFSTYGPIMVLYYEIPGEPDPVRDGLCPAFFLLLSERHIEYKYMSCQELMAHPSVVKDYRGILFYNDPENFVLPPEVPAVQVFGWSPMRQGQDRITANDEQVVELAVNQLTRGDIDRAVIIWSHEMVAIPNHPRIIGFLDAMKARNIQVESLPFYEKKADFLPILKTYLASGSERVGFFAFNAYCGLKLCCALDSLGLMGKYGRDGLVVCDHSPLLYSFSPRPVMIDLNLPQMAEFALDALCRRLKRPDLPRTILLQSPSLVSFVSA